MKFLQVLFIVIFSQSAINSLYAGSSSESEESSDLSVFSARYKSPFYGKAIATLTEHYGAELASTILPTYLDKKETSADWDFRASDDPSYDEAVKDVPSLERDQVRLGARTLLPKSSLKIIKIHFFLLKSMLGESYCDLESSLRAAEKTHLHKAGNIHDVVNTMTGIQKN